MIRVLTAEDVSRVLVLEDLLSIVESGLVEQTRGAVERPHRPHFPVGRGLDSDDPLGMGITMPAYVHGADYYVTKLVDVHEGNAGTDRPTLHAQIVLTDARTGEPVSLMEGTLVTNARTGCIGGLAVRALTEGPVTLGVIGAGAQARWQTRGIAAATEVRAVRIFSPSDSRDECAADLRGDGLDARAVETREEAVRGADVVVTATTATEPVFPAEALEPGAVVVSVGAYTAEMQELEPSVLESAAQVFADVPAEVAETGDVLATDLVEEDLLELGSLLAGEVRREDPEAPVVVDSVGSAVLDAVAAEHLLEAAIERRLGLEIEF